MPYLYILEKELKKRNLLSYLKSAPSNLSNLKMCKIWTKNILLKYFWGKTLKRIVLFKISFLKFASLQNFLRKQKCLTLGLKMADWVFLTRNLLSVYFKARIFEKSVVIFEISTLKFVQFKNFLKKKRLNLGEKIPYLSILH